MNQIKVVSKELGDILLKNSPTIFTGLGVAGLVTTVAMGIKATPKAMRILAIEKDFKKSKAELEGGHPLGSVDLTKMEIIKLTWRCYLPTALMGLTTIGCIISSNAINLRRNAALASVYSIAETTLREYQEKVVQTIGEKKEMTVRDEIAQDHLNSNPVEGAQVFLTGKGTTLCYDSLSGRYFQSDIEAIRRVQNDFNRELINEGYVSLNELYYMLGLENIRMGDDMGWNIESKMLDISFSAKIATDGQPCIVLNYIAQPRKL